MIRTLIEAAAELKVSERQIRILIARHHPPVLRTGSRGGKVLLDDPAMSALIEAMRCHSPSRAAKTRRSGGSPVGSAALAYEKALALATAR